MRRPDTEKIPLDTIAKLVVSLIFCFELMEVLPAFIPN